MILRVATIMAALTLSAAPVAGSDWFTHPYGELRAYHGDWLAVCNDNGLGPCRTVQMRLQSGEAHFGSARIAVLVLNGGYGMDLFMRGLDASAASRLGISIDGVEFDVGPTQFRAGEHGVINVAETVTLTDPDLTASLVNSMRAGRWMQVEIGAQSWAISLRGISASLDGISTQLAPAH
jgi:hypothetical protein